MLSTIFSLAAPALLGPAGLGLSISPMVASAIGGGIGSLLQGGSTQDALQGAALGGLGGFLGGKLAGVDPTLAANTATPFAQGAGQGSGEFLRTGLASSGSAAQLATPQTIGQQAGLMSQLTRPEAVGAGLGGLMADSMIKPPEYEQKEKRIFPEGMAPEDTVRFKKKRDPDDTLSLIHI